MFAFALCEKCYGYFDIVLKGGSSEWIFEWGRWREYNTIRNDMAIDDFFINHVRAWVWLKMYIECFSFVISNQFGEPLPYNRLKNIVEFRLVENSEASHTLKPSSTGTKNVWPPFAW